MMAVKKILFVCLGNICRSPMAEFIFKHMVKEDGKEEQYLISSAATHDDETYGGGSPVYPPARKKLAQHGISCNGKRAVRMTKSDYGKYDLIIAMEPSNVRDILRITGGDPEGKVRLLLSYAGREGGIADPWYSGNFDKAYEDIYEGCKGLYNELKKQSK